MGILNEVLLRNICKILNIFFIWFIFDFMLVLVVLCFLIIDIL